MIIYYGRDGKPISQEEALRLFESMGERRVALDLLCSEVGITTVSTVHIVLDHSFAWSPRDMHKPNPNPVIFETMVFGMEEEHQQRYVTEAQALEGHREVVRKAVGRRASGLAPEPLEELVEDSANYGQAEDRGDGHGRERHPLAALRQVFALLPTVMDRVDVGHALRALAHAVVVNPTVLPSVLAHTLIGREDG